MTTLATPRQRPRTPRRPCPARAAWLLLLAVSVSAPLGAATVPAAPPGGGGAPGHQLWRTPLPAGSLPYGQPAADHERLFLVLEDGIHAFDAATGRPLWQSPHETYLPRALVLAGELLIAAESTVTARSRQTGRVRWRFEPEGNTSLGQPASDGGVVYVGTDRHRVHALGARTGRQRWSADVGRGFEHQGVVRGVSADRHTVYVALEQWRSPNGHQTSGHLVALARRGGAERWRFVVGEGDERRGASSRPVLAGRLVLVSDYLGNAIYALDRRSGRLAWRFEGERGAVGVAEPPRVHRGRVYWATGDAHAYALELASGRLLWRRPLRAGAEAFTTCGSSLVVNTQGLAYLARRDGSERTRLLDDAEEFTTGGLAVASGRLLAAGPKAAYALRCAPRR